jgi:hypothetical protein
LVGGVIESDIDDDLIENYVKSPAGFGGELSHTPVMPRKDHAKRLRLSVGSYLHCGSQQCPTQSLPSPFPFHDECSFGATTGIAAVDFHDASKSIL